MIAEMPTVIAPEHDDCIRREIKPIQLVQHAADLGVNIAHCCVIAVDHRPRLLIGQWASLGYITVLAKFAPAAWRKPRRSFRRRAQRRQIERRAIIKIPILLRRAEWEMGFHKTHSHEERFIRARPCRLQSVDRLVCEYAIWVSVI